MDRSGEVDHDGIHFKNMSFEELSEILARFGLRALYQLVFLTHWEPVENMLLSEVALLRALILVIPPPGKGDDFLAYN
jgi:hypothetical protein